MTTVENAPCRRGDIGDRVLDVVGQVRGRCAAMISESDVELKVTSRSRSSAWARRR
jgi:hypothetical protein